MDGYVEFSYDILRKPDDPDEFLVAIIYRDVCYTVKVTGLNILKLEALLLNLATKLKYREELELKE